MKRQGPNVKNYVPKSVVTLIYGLSVVVMCILAGCDTVAAPQPTAIIVPQPAATPSPTTRVAPSPTTRPRPTSTPTTSPAATNTRGPSPTETPPPVGWREVKLVPPGKKQIAITFDAGASGETLPLILQTLRERNLHITMFLTGKFAERYPAGVKQAADDGHEMGNHTYSHLDSTKITDERLEGELARTEKIIYNLTGVSTRPYWRPPYGARNNHIQSVAVSQGYRSIYWTLDSHDSVGKPKTPDFIFERVTNPEPKVELDGAIVLMHFGSQATAEALPRILDRLAEMGLHVVTISELLGDR